MTPADPQPAKVEVIPASLADRYRIDGLMQFYMYDFSEMEPPGSVNFEVGDDGLFQPYPHMDSYWAEADRHPLLIRVNGAAAGFALVNSHSHVDDGHVERNMGEFFLARKHRGRGVADEAVRQIFERLPGHWEVAVAQRNVRALAFWPRAIAAAGARNLVKGEGDGVHWTGPIWSFDIG